jgi:hypothetical protein
MTILRATITGNLRQAMDAEVRKVSGALRRAVTTAGQQVQGELRAQARNAGFRDGGKSVANAWRMRVYPVPGRAPATLKPAALVWSRMPAVVDAFDKGATITAKGGRYLAWPTGYNAGAGRRGAGRRAGLRITPEQMTAAGRRGEAFVLPSKANPRVRLWCLRVAGAYGVTKRTRNRLRLFVGTGTEVATGRTKGLQQRRRELLKQGFVPMFFLARQVSLRKRLSVDQVRARAAGLFARAAAAELSRLPA